MEILHALIDPLHNGVLRLADGGTQDAGSAEHAVFFLRDPDYLKEIAHADTHRIYTNEAESDPAKADTELKRWREEVIPGTGRPAFDYSASWQENESTPEIALPLYVPTTAPQGSEIWNTAFVRWAKLWESKGVRVGDGGEITDQAELAKAMAYNQAFTHGRLGGFRHGGDDLADIVIGQLKAAITKRFGERAEQAPTPLQRELDQQAQSLQAAGEGFIERAGDFDALNGYLAGGETRPFALTAYAGMGKTSLLAHFIETYQVKSANESVHYRFIGGSDDSVGVERLVRSLLAELNAQGKIRSGIPNDTTDMLNKLPDLLKEAGQNGKTILVVDALNQLESGMSDLSWIPDALPENVKLVVSFKRGDKDAEEYYAEHAKNQTMVLHGVKPFDSMDDRKKLVTAYLGQYFKELDEPRIEALISADGAGNPLFLKIALSELRVFGVHNDLSAMIRNSFGDTPVSAFGAVLSRMESDPAYAELSPAVSLPHVFGWLAHSKYGLAVEELRDLLVREKLADSQAGAQDAVYLILRQLRPYLAKRDGRVDFFYESFKIAATERYTKDHPYARTGQEWHRSLAEYFETLPLENRHRLMEQAWQYAMAGMEENYQALLFDYRFVEARLTAFDVDTLISDHEYSQEELIGLLKECHQLSAHVLSEHKEQLPCQLWGRLADLPQKEIRALLEQVVSVKRERGEPWLRPHVAFSEMPGGALQRTITETFDDLAFVTGKLHGLIRSEYVRFDALSGRREAAFTFGILGQGHGNISQDASLLAVADNDKKTLSIVDIATREIWELGGYTENAGRLLFSKGNKYLISVQNDLIRVWDIESKKCLYKKEMEVNVHSMLDGERFIVATNTEIKVLRIKTGKVLKIIQRKDSDSSFVFCLLRGGQIYASNPESLIELRDIDTDKLLYSPFKNPGRMENALVLNDKLFVATEDSPSFLSVIDLKTGTAVRNYPAEIFYSRDIYVDGNFAVTYWNWNKEVRIWNLFRNASERRNMGYSDEVAIDSKGELAILQIDVPGSTSGMYKQKLIAFDVAKNRIRHFYEPAYIKELRLINNDRHISFIDGRDVVHAINTQTGAAAFTLDPLDCPDIFEGDAPTRAWSLYEKDGIIGTLYAEDKIFIAYRNKKEKRDYVSVWMIATGKLLHKARLEYEFESFMLAEDGKALVVTQTTPRDKPPEVSDEDYRANKGSYMSVYNAMNMKRLHFNRIYDSYLGRPVLLSTFGQRAMYESRSSVFECNIETGEKVSPNRAVTKITETTQLEQANMLRFSFDDTSRRKILTVSAYDMSGSAPFKELASIHTDGLASSTFAHNREGAVRIACCSNTKQMLFFTLENVFWKGRPEPSTIDFGAGEAQGEGHISYPAPPPTDARKEESAAFEWDTPVPVETQTAPPPRPQKTESFFSRLFGKK
jgi:hypothetical protein